MKKVYLLIFTFLLAISAISALLQDMSKVELQSTKVAGTVYAITGTDDANAFSGGNIGVSVGEDGVLMVDSKMAPLSDKIKAAIKEIGGDLPKYVINTHVHGDHTGANAAFSTEGTIVAHTNVRKRLSDQPEETWPVITFDESMSIHMNGEEIKAYHYPNGHTDGDAVIYFKGSNVLHMGDHWFHELLPYVDLGNGGTVQGYTKNIERTIEEMPDDVKIITGHGAPVATKNDLKTFHRMLTETTALVTKKMKDGQSLEEIKKSGLQDEWKSWSWRFITTERWIETIYNSYSKEVSSK